MVMLKVKGGGEAVPALQDPLEWALKFNPKLMALKRARHGPDGPVLEVGNRVAMYQREFHRYREDKRLQDWQIEEFLNPILCPPDLE